MPAQAFVQIGMFDSSTVKPLVLHSKVSLYPCGSNAVRVGEILWEGGRMELYHPLPKSRKALSALLYVTIQARKIVY